MAPMLDHSSITVATDGVDTAVFRPYEPRESASKRTFPRIDDHLIKPEVSRFELIRGREVDVSGADPPHADAQARLAFLILAHVVVGFVVSTELLTRMAQKSNFATDVCVRKDGVDPLTDTRYLEEVAFEIVNEQGKRNVTNKAEDMVRRGVRRMFAIFVKTGQVAEWSAKTRKFVFFAPDASISDPVFVRPVPVQALLDQSIGEDEAALALITKRNPAIVKRELEVEQKSRKKGLAAGRKKGRIEGRIEGHKQGLDEGLRVGRNLLLSMIQMRFGDVPACIRERIEAADAPTVQAWGQKVLTSTSLEAAFAA